METLLRDAIGVIGATIIIVSLAVTGWRAQVWLEVFFPETEDWRLGDSGAWLGLVIGLLVVFWPDPPPPDQADLERFEEFLAYPKSYQTHR